MKPNILFLFADDERYNTIHALGNDEIITPNLDELVRKGTTFTQCHIPGGTSPAVCMPSRAMLHTGRHLFALEGEGQEIPDIHALLGETLKENGYDTFGTGKWHNGIRSYARSFNNGDEIFFGGMDDHWNVPVHSFDPTGKYENRRYKVQDYMHSNQKSKYISDHVGLKHSTELFSDAAIDFINNKASKEKPFFGYVSFMAPHDPRTMPERFKKMYNVDDIKIPENFSAYHWIEYGNTQCRDEMLAPYPRTVENTKEQLLEYYAMITHIDEEIGKIINALKDKGLYDNTIIIYSADNGLALGQHGLFGKQSLYEHSVRVPFIIAGPNIPENEKRDAFIYLMDIFPTLCDIVDINIPKSVNGKSFYKCILDESTNIRDDLYFAYTDKIRGVKDKQFKLIEHVYKGVLTTQLFDLKNDPLEMMNLAHDSRYSNKVNELRKKMKEYCINWNEKSHRFGKEYWNQYNSLV